ncbi:sensor histidine kinase [Candidatus Thiodiazotropha sp. CDECU1]|uniref:sensor histidine kinase n=1 Tax=Candidatus Thiodiazotropha sp. CDECU1 TaxID=3065865 RepID=UPI00292CED72|nr:sensor histidine kinase [Candidatus Thiodiazotropha sp. CDECU1]
MPVAKKNSGHDLFSHAQLPVVINKSSQQRKSPATSSAFNEEEERKRLSRELHDGLGQLLTTIGLQVQQCLDNCDSTPLSCPSPQEHKASLQQISGMVKEAIGEVRSICSTIRPAILDDLGVLAAISWQCRQISRASPSLNIVTDYRIEEDQIPTDFRNVIYRIVQESLNNALKYSHANRIEVTLSLQNDSIHLSVIDNGIGFDLASMHETLGVGLLSMRERAASLQGKLEIRAAHTIGVEIRAHFPLKTMTLCKV